MDTFQKKSHIESKATFLYHARASSSSDEDAPEAAVVHLQLEAEKEESDDAETGD